MGVAFGFGGGSHFGAAGMVVEAVVGTVDIVEVVVGNAPPASWQYESTGCFATENGSCVVVVVEAGAGATGTAGAGFARGVVSWCSWWSWWSGAAGC